MMKVAAVHAKHPHKRHLAVAVYDDILAHDDRDPTALEKRAFLLVSQFDEKKATKALVALLEVRPRMAKAWRELAKVTSDPKLAEEAYERYLVLRPKDWRMWNNYGLFVAHFGDNERAVTLVKRALMVTPADERELIQKNLDSLRPS